MHLKCSHDLKRATEIGANVIGAVAVNIAVVQCDRNGCIHGSNTAETAAVCIAACQIETGQCAAVGELKKTVLSLAVDGNLSPAVNGDFASHLNRSAAHGDGSSLTEGNHIPFFGVSDRVVECGDRQLIYDDLRPSLRRSRRVNGGGFTSCSDRQKHTVLETFQTKGTFANLLFHLTPLLFDISHIKRAEHLLS